MQIINWFVFYFGYAYLIRLCDVTKPTKMAASIKVHLQIFKRPQLPNFSTDYKLNWYLFFFFLIQFNVPFKIISLIETSQSIGGAKQEYPGKTT